MAKGFGQAKDDTTFRVLQISLTELLVIKGRKEIHWRWERGGGGIFRHNVHYFSTCPIPNVLNRNSSWKSYKIFMRPKRKKYGDIQKRLNVTWLGSVNIKEINTARCDHLSDVSAIHAAIGLSQPHIY